MSHLEERLFLFLHWINFDKYYKWAQYPPLPFPLFAGPGNMDVMV